MIVPRPYQTAAVEAVYEHLRTKDNNPCVVLPTGTGKAVILAMIASDAVKKWNGRVLILAHVKELLEQNAGKIRALCPELKVGIFSAGLKSRDTSEQVIVAGIQSVYDKACELGAFDLIVVDECFPAGTLIETPRGQIPIENLYVGQPVVHALGVGNVEAISSRPAFEFIKLELNNGNIIECTPNHRFFTESGWCKASAMAVGTRLFCREDVSRLRQGFSSNCMVRSERKTNPMPNGKDVDSPGILFSSMFENCKNTFEGNTIDIEKCSTFSGKLAATSENGGKNLSLLREGIPSAFLPYETDVGKDVESARFLLHILLEESQESNVPAGSDGEGIRDAENNRSQTIDSWRERKRFTFAAGTTGATIGSGNGISGHDNGATAALGCIALLQTGCGNPVSTSGNTTGRRESLCEKNPQNGQTDSGMAGGVRVVGITRLKLKSPRTVYNLQVAGHPSFYADGVLVHNCHLITPDGDGMYRSFMKDMAVINPHVRLIGLTATPYRLKGGLICKEENLLNEICYEVGLKEMIQQGYLSPLVSRAGRSEAKLDGLHVRGGEFINDEVASAMDTDELVSSACREIVDLTRDRKSVLIFTSSVDHCRHVAEKIEAFSGQECAMVTGETPSGERAEIIRRFKGDFVPADLFGTPKPPLKFLANVNVLCLSEDTEILTSKGFVGIDAMSFDHLIAAWKTDGSIEFTHPQNIIIRDRAQDESMVSVQNGQVPLYRVTDGHRMVIACGEGKKKIKTVSAKELIGKRHCIPASGIATPFPLEPKQPILNNVAGRIRSNSYSYRKKGIPAPLAKHMADELIARQRQMKYKSPSELTIPECELIGFWVGDGTKANNRYSICQSMRYPSIVNWIDRHIETIGLHAARNVKPRVGKMTNEAVVWTFAKGTGGDKQYVEGGIFPYLPYLEKGWNDLLFAFSQKQYESFLYGLWLADGLHTDDLTATHFHVSSDAYELYNCLQAIGAMRGFSTILHKAETPRQQHQQQQWIFRWAKKKHLCYLKHSAVLENDFRPERVWCVTSTTGYLICRRNGKTFVTGNCTGFDAPNTDCVVLLRPTNSAGLYVQMVGRATRLSPETGKSSALILDYGGNVLRHGPVDMINIKEPGAGKGGDAPAKKCPKCLALIHAGYAKCPECGYEFPPSEGNDKLSRNASTAGIISGQVEHTDYEVLDTFYAVHEKRYAEPGTPRTMRVDYRIGFNDFKSEWVCPEHTGYARGKFEKWWRERAALGCPIPATAHEAVALANEGLLAEPESITVKSVAGEKFDRITGWRLKPRPVMREPGDDSREIDAEFDPPSNSPADLGVTHDEYDDSVPF